MTREEAQAAAERNVLDYARRGLLERVALKDGSTLLLQACRMLAMAMDDLRAAMREGRLHTGAVASLAALCIELLREEQLDSGHHERQETTYGEHNQQRKN